MFTMRIPRCLELCRYQCHRREGIRIFWENPPGSSGLVGDEFEAVKRAWMSRCPAELARLIEADSCELGDETRFSPGVRAVAGPSPVCGV